MNKADEIYYSDNYGTNNLREIKKIDEELKNELTSERIAYAVAQSFMPNKEFVLDLTERLSDSEKTIRQERTKLNIENDMLTPTERLINHIDRNVLFLQFQLKGYSNCDTNTIVNNIFKNYTKIQSLNADDYEIREDYDAVVRPEKERYARLKGNNEKELN